MGDNTGISHISEVYSRTLHIETNIIGSSKLISCRSKETEVSPDLDGDLGFARGAADDVPGNAFKDFSECTTSQELGQRELVAVEVRQRSDVLIRGHDTANIHQWALLLASFAQTTEHTKIKLTPKYISYCAN